MIKVNKQILYVETIKETYPELDIRSARLHTDEGQFNDILFVNDGLIFRFPRYEASIYDFLQEIKILQKLQGYLSLPIPDPIYISRQKNAVGQVFMGYKILPGRPLFREVLASIPDTLTLETFARQLANFLQELHSISPAALGLNLPASNQLTDTKQLFSSIQEDLFPLMRPAARTSVIQHFENYFNNSSLHRYEPCLIHGDFGGSNLLFDTNRISGVIDFSFAGSGDPAVDVAALSTFGDPFFALFCRYYSPNESLLERASFYRGTFALQEALHGFHNHDDKVFQIGMEKYI